MTDQKTKASALGNRSGEMNRFVHSSVSMLMPLLPLILTLLVFGALSPRFLGGPSLALMLNTLAFVGIVAVGQTLLIICGEFDLSVGAVAALSGYLAASLMVNVGLPIGAGLLLGLGVGLVAGWLNGWVTTYLKVPSFIATFGMSSIALGITGFLSRGESVFPIPEVLGELGDLSLGRISMIAIFFLIVVVLAELLMRRTRFGRHIMATGSNPETASILGIRTRRVKMMTFTLVGGLAAVAGLLQMMALGAGNPSVGASWPLLSIAAVVIGGTSLFGGSGSVLATLIGVLTLQAISDGIVSVGLNTNWQTFAIGVLMIVVVAVDIARRRRAAGR